MDVALELLNTDKVESISIGLRGLKDWDSVKEAVETKFPSLEAIPFSVLDEVYYQHSVDWLKAQFGVIQIIILTIVLLGILNVISGAIFERKQEIGNLRANGESVLDILKLLSAEGAALGLLGSLLGIGLSYLLNATFLSDGILMPPAPGLTRQFHVMIELQPLTALYASGLGILTALIASLTAGIRVSRLPIGDALRSV